MVPKESNSIYNCTKKSKILRSTYNQESKIIVQWKLQNITEVKTQINGHKYIKDINKWKDNLCSLIGRLNIVKILILPKTVYRFNNISIKIPKSFFVEIEKSILKFMLNLNKPWRAKNLEEEQRRKSLISKFITRLLQYSCLANSMERAWWATVRGISRVGHDLATKPPPPQSCSNQNCGTGIRQTYRSMAQKTQIKPSHVWSSDFLQGFQDNSTGKSYSLQQMVLGKRDVHVQKTEVRHLPFITYKS